MKLLSAGAGGPLKTGLERLCRVIGVVLDAEGSPRFFLLLHASCNQTERLKRAFPEKVPAGMRICQKRKADMMPAFIDNALAAVSRPYL